MSGVAAQDGIAQKLMQEELQQLGVLTPKEQKHTLPWPEVAGPHSLSTARRGAPLNAQRHLRAARRLTVAAFTAGATASRMCWAWATTTCKSCRGLWRDVGISGSGKSVPRRAARSPRCTS